MANIAQGKAECYVYLSQDSHQVLCISCKQSGITLSGGLLDLSLTDL